jgi:GNAT superfamily N-acetyltransferase
MANLTFREVDRGNWSDFARLFEDRGGPKSCWCMVWRASPAEARHRDGASRRGQMKSRIDTGTPVRILACEDDTPIAWCSIAPRDSYRPLGGPDDLAGSEHVWSLACLFIRSEFRGQGLAGRLIREAVDRAARNGATIVEAYPVDPRSPSYRFMGFVETFRAAGFKEVGSAGRRRHVMRLAVRRTAGGTSA